MKKVMKIVGMAVVGGGLLLSSAVFADGSCTAPLSINFKIVSSAPITSAVFGNMVDPASGAFWFGPIANSTWTWNYNGNNCNKFALRANFDAPDFAVGNVALGAIVVDPTKMQNNATVTVNLKACTQSHNYVVTIPNPVDGVSAQRLGQDTAPC